MNTRRVLKLFLASPSDLKTERNEAKVIVDKFNSLWSDHLKCHVELVAWEDTVSAYGRPQSIINKELEQCELFFGMIWKRWGTPPANTGRFTSGFHEEYELSAKRFQKTSWPKISLAFKSVEVDSLADPGEELKKVLSFKERTILEKKVLFCEFDTLESFRALFERTLVDQVQALIEEEFRLRAIDLDSQFDLNARQTAVDYFLEDALLTVDGAKFAHNLIDRISRTPSLESLPPSDVARFRLLSAICAQPGNDQLVLGSHDANLIYINRLSFSMARPEFLGLLRTGIEQMRSETVPIWRWVSATDAIEDGTIQNYTLGGGVALQVGAINLMRLTRLPIIDRGLSREIVVSSWFSDEVSNAVRIAALGYLDVCGVEADLPLIKSEIERNNYATKSLASNASLKIRARIGTFSLVAQLLDPGIESVTSDVLLSVTQEIEKAESNLLRPMLSSGSHDVRTVVAGVLRKRKALSIVEAEILLADPSLNVRLEGLFSMRQLGEDVGRERARSVLSSRNSLGTALGGFSGSEPDINSMREYYIDKLRFASVGELDKLVVAEELFSADAFLMRAARFRGKHAAALRVALRDRFARFYDAQVENLSQEIADRARGFGAFVRREMTRSALTVLENYEERGDIELIRDILSDTELPFASSDTSYLEKFGDWTDLPLLTGLCNRPSETGRSILGSFSESPKTYSLVGGVIALLARGRLGNVFSLELPSPLLREVIRAATAKEIRALTDSEVMVILNSEDDTVRRISAIKIARWKTSSYVSRILRLIIRRERYFYNVVHWLDIAVSTPADFSKGMLDREIEAS